METGSKDEISKLKQTEIGREVVRKYFEYSNNKDWSSLRTLYHEKYPNLSFDRTGQFKRQDTFNDLLPIMTRSRKIRDEVNKKSTNIIDQVIELHRYHAEENNEKSHIIDIIAEGGVVWIHYITTSISHLTGKSSEIEGIYKVKICEGKIIDTAIFPDLFTLLLQLAEVNIHQEDGEEIKYYIDSLKAIGLLPENVELKIKG